MARPDPASNRYRVLIEKVFFDHWQEGAAEFEFERTEIEAHAAEQNIALPKNIGDLIYSFRFRTALPEKILATQPEGLEWVIEGAGRARYRFKLVRVTRIKMLCLGCFAQRLSRPLEASDFTLAPINRINPLVRVLVETTPKTP